MNLETDKLLIVPLSKEIVKKLDNSEEKLSQDFYRNSEWPEPDLKEAFPAYIKLLDRNGCDGFNLWLVVEKESNLVIGSLGFKGRPNSKGEVEIGFGIIPSKRGMGYSVQAVNILTCWALGHTEVSSVIAFCDKENIASRKVLANSGYLLEGEENNLFSWRIKKDN